MPKTLDLKKLRAFCLVAKHGSLQRAAAQLLLTVPAVFAQVRGLEEDVGVTLLKRVGRGLSLTPAGEVFLKKAGPILDAVSDAVESVSHGGMPRTRISIAIVNDLTRYFAQAIGQVVREHEDIDLSLRVRRSPETIALVLDGEVDLGIGYFSVVPRDIVKTTVLQSGFSLVCPSNHPLAHHSKPKLEDIAQHRLISFPAESNMGRRVANAFAAKGIELTGVIEAGSCQSSREFAEVGIGAAIVHTVCLGHERSKKLHRFDLGQSLGLADIAVIRRKSHASTAAHKELIRILKSHVQGH